MGRTRSGPLPPQVWRHCTGPKPDWPPPEQEGQDRHGCRSPPIPSVLCSHRRLRQTHHQKPQIPPTIHPAPDGTHVPPAILPPTRCPDHTRATAYPHDMRQPQPDPPPAPTAPTPPQEPPTTPATAPPPLATPAWTTHVVQPGNIPRSYASVAQTPTKSPVRPTSTSPATPAPSRPVAPRTTISPGPSPRQFSPSPQSASSKLLPTMRPPPPRRSSRGPKPVDRYGQ